mmetsp:Transcript_39726/g.51248  ORF Transcript_39726/g.51248 Transcript_39726/m.51248 type:complete len:229 (+) Transcript_39726:962-1648(+)
MSKFQTPQWVAKPTASMHLEVQGKPQTVTSPINLGEKSSYIFGRLQQLVDIEINDHPSISRQHAAICHGIPLAPSQYQGGAVIIDLASANGTFLGPNPQQLQRLAPNKYELLKEGSCIRFGESPLIYVVKGLEAKEPVLSEAERQKAAKEALGNLAVYSDSESDSEKKTKKKVRVCCLASHEELQKRLMVWLKSKINQTETSTFLRHVYFFLFWRAISMIQKTRQKKK